MESHKFIVIKGRNDFVGSHGLRYEVFDRISFDCDINNLKDEQRKYVFEKLYRYDRLKNPLSFRENVWCRRRHIMMKNDEIFSERVKIFDHSSGIFYGFIPIESFIF